MRQDLEILVLELKLSETHWLVIGTYKPPSLSEIAFTFKVSNILIFYQSTHDNILLMGNFDMTPNNPKLSELIADHELCILVSKLTCFKSINPTCIGNCLTNKKTLRSTFAKGEPRKCFTVTIETLTIKSLKKNCKSNYPQRQILNHFNLHLKSF